MEWRIITVLCLIGILHVPGKAAQMNNSTNSTIVYKLHFSINGTFLDVYSNSTNNATVDLRNNITSQVEPLYKAKYTNFERFDILQFRNGSIVTEGELKFINGSKPNVTDLAQILNNGSFTFAIIKIATSIAEVTPQNHSTTAATPATPNTNQTATKVAKINLGFSIVQDFKDIYSDLNNNETKVLSSSIITECSRVYKSRFPKFLRMFIQKFSKGSIVVDSVLEFDSTNGTSPNVTDVRDTLVTAITNGNFSLTINNSSINATDIPETSAATTETTPVTNQTATTNMNQTTTNVTSQTATPVTTVSTPAKVAKINLVFSIVQEFKDIYSNLSNAETKVLSNSITTECSQVYKRRFPKFFRMFIQKFSKGSVVVDSVLEFDSTNGTSPNVTDVKDTLVTAITNGNFSLTINNSSINATDIPETSVTTTANTSTPAPATTVSAASTLTDYNITFKLNNNFTNELSNMTSDGAKKLAKNITSELDGFYKGFKNFKRSSVWRFRSGSIDVDGLLGFTDSIANNPNVKELARGLAEAVRNGTVKLSIDPKTIRVTDSSGLFANRSPVLASMLTALWMTLASLLLSAVMH